MTDMRILTVRQPWAGAIIWRGKNVENRTRNLAGDWRGTVAIHVALRHNYEAVSAHNAIAGYIDEHSIYGYGCIIGVVDLVEAHCGSISERWDALEEHNAQCSPWAEPDLFHLVLANPRPLSVPILYRGALGLRRLPDDVAERVMGATP